MTEESAESSGRLSECSIKAMDLLARRPHFRRQLEAKLRQRGFEDAQIAEVCDRLERRKFLDDLECARSLVNGALRRKAYGPRRVRVELVKRGATEEVGDQAVREAFSSGEEPLLRESAARWLRSRDLDRQRLARHLERKGFSGGAIFRVMGELGNDSGAVIEDDSC